MLSRAVGLASAIAIATGASALAEGPPPAFTAISPIYSQLVVFSLPSNFKTVFENSNGKNYIREAALKDETTERWSQMITVTGAKGLAHDPAITPESFAASIAGGFKSACPENFTATVLGPAKYSGQEAFAAVASCGKVAASEDKHSETALIVAVKGTDDYYTIQWAERTPSSAENLTIDAGKWKARLDNLRPIRFCPIVPGETAPFRSCMNQQ